MFLKTLHYQAVAEVIGLRIRLAVDHPNPNTPKLDSVGARGSYWIIGLCKSNLIILSVHYYLSLSLWSCLETQNVLRTFDLEQVSFEKCMFCFGQCASGSFEGLRRYLFAS